jgi:hypothetical protein
MRVIVIGAANCFQNHTGCVQKMVGSLIIPSLLVH